MQVTLINTTKDAEKTIMYCARVSNPANQDSGDTRLLSYCIKHGHWSIFEMADMTVEIITSRAIAPQILRHKSFVFQEFSQRYAKISNFEPVELRLQGDSKQGSSKLVPQHELSLNDIVDRATQACQNAYEELLQHGVSRECARFVLPGRTQTRLYMKGSVRSWIHYLKVRTAQDTQKEHRMIALEIKNLFIENFPTIAKALDWVQSPDWAQPTENTSVEKRDDLSVHTPIRISRGVTEKGYPFLAWTCPICGVRKSISGGERNENLTGDTFCYCGTKLNWEPDLTTIR